MDSRKSFFSIAGQKSSDYGIILTKAPTRSIPERDRTIIQVPGRSGDLVIDNGRYLNTIQEYACLLLPPKGQTLRQAADRLGELLAVQTYAELWDSFDPEHFRLAYPKGSVDLESIVERGGTFSVSLECMPQRYRRSGQETNSFRGNGSLENPTRQEAKPLIRVELSGAGVLGVGGTTVEIAAGEPVIYLDSESQNAYKLSGTVAENRNSLIKAPVFPTLAPGKNAITISGGISSVTITPRWWDL